MPDLKTLLSYIPKERKNQKCLGIYYFRIDCVKEFNSNHLRFAFKHLSFSGRYTYVDINNDSVHSTEDYLEPSKTKFYTLLYNEKDILNDYKFNWSKRLP
jgi:hypothetical protein